MRTIASMFDESAATAASNAESALRTHRAVDPSRRYARPAAVRSSDDQGAAAFSYAAASASARLNDSLEVAMSCRQLREGHLGDAPLD